MKPKPITSLFAFTVMVFFSGFSVVFADDFQSGLDAWFEEDFDTAYKFFAPLAEQGDKLAQYRLGFIYDNGLGVPQDFKVAVKWYRLAAEQGDKLAQYRLGVMYDAGQGVPQDFKVAVKWYRLAAEQGDKLAQYRLGMMYDNGQVVPQDYKKAFKWLLKSAEQMNLKAQRLIRTNYHQRHKQIAEQGDSYAQRFLGASYYLGLGVTQDYAEAAKWYKKAAEQEDRVAQNILGSMYEKGKGVSKDFVEAYKWFSLSEETGNEHKYKEKIGKRKMTSAQIAEAQKLTREWIEQYQKK